MNLRFFVGKICIYQKKVLILQSQIRKKILKTSRNNRKKILKYA